MTNNHEYPTTILPKNNYKDKIDIDLLLASNKYIYVLRRSDKNFEQTFQVLDGEYLLRTDAILPERLPKLSLNLLGGFFLPEHLKYKITNKSIGGQKWVGNKNFDFTTFINDYEEIEVGCPIYFHANEIDGTSFPYTYPFAKETAKVVDKYQAIIGGGVIKPIKDPDNINNFYYEVSGSVKLEHDPLNLNYWHTEMLTLAFNNTEIIKKGPAWQDKYFNSVMTHILKANAYASVENIGNIDPAIYT